MIGLLIDAVTAVVVVVDRVCNAVEKNVRPQAAASPPLPSEGGAPSPGAVLAATGPGGHPQNSHAEPLFWGPTT